MPFMIRDHARLDAQSDLVRQSEAAQSEVEAAPSCGFMKPRFMKQESKKIMRSLASMRGEYPRGEYP